MKDAGGRILFLCFLTFLSGVSGANWGFWSLWTRCSKSCGRGTQYRWRYCSGGAPGTHGCPGDWWQSSVCYISHSCFETISTTTKRSTTTKATTTTTKVTPTTAQNCYNPADKESYRGTLSKTEKGLICQAWKSQYPHQHKFNPERYPTSDLTANWCRNPDHDQKPWCFTTRKHIQWDFCSVPICSEVAPGTPSTTSRPPVVSRPPTATSHCGNPDVPMSDEIVGGVETVPGSIPWQASLRRSSSGSHFCGASLIKRSWLITAAHCITEPQNPSTYHAILGDHYQYRRDDTERRVDFSAIYRHRNYGTTTLENDITLMKMRSPVTYNTYIKPVCLPAENSVLPKNELVTVSGWGSTKGTGSNAVLNRASVPIVSNSQCKNLLGGIKSTMLCAGFMAGGKDSCQGDSGGPLIWKSAGGSYQLVGIVSWGYGCAEARKPGVYTRVSNYIGWINNIIGNH